MCLQILSVDTWRDDDVGLLMKIDGVCLPCLSNQNPMDPHNPHNHFTTVMKWPLGGHIICPSISYLFIATTDVKLKVNS